MALSHFLQFAVQAINLYVNESIILAKYVYLLLNSLQFSHMIRKSYVVTMISDRSFLLFIYKAVVDVSLSEPFLHCCTLDFLDRNPFI